MATDTKDAKDVKDVKDVKDEPPADTRDALDVLEAEAKEWEKASHHHNNYDQLRNMANNLNPNRMPK